MHNIPYPFPEGYDDKGIMDLLDNGDEIPVVGDLEMRFIAFTLVVLTRTVIHPDLLLTVTGTVTFLVILIFAITQIFNL
ncbi:hypothetical protein PT115_09180, partial [Erysipelothrix rhusiopathiae]|nr:hypothetical protein [Erysipelothrix rhusiopathiae]